MIPAVAEEAGELLEIVTKTLGQYLGRLDVALSHLHGLGTINLWQDCGQGIGYLCALLLHLLLILL